MSVAKTAPGHAEEGSLRLHPRHIRALKRRAREVRSAVKTSAIKLCALDVVRSMALGHVAAASEQEAQIVETFPMSVDRAQFVVDQITHALGAEITVFAEHLRQI